MHQIKDERGMTLVIVLLTITVFSILGLAVMGASINNMKQVTKTESDIHNTDIAEMGVQYVKQEIENKFITAFPATNPVISLDQFDTLKVALATITNKKDMYDSNKKYFEIMPLTYLEDKNKAEKWQTLSNNLTLYYDKDLNEYAISFLSKGHINGNEDDLSIRLKYKIKSKITVNYRITPEGITREYTLNTINSLNGEDYKLIGDKTINDINNLKDSTLYFTGSAAIGGFNNISDTSNIHIVGTLTSPSINNFKDSRIEVRGKTTIDSINNIDNTVVLIVEDFTSSIRIHNIKDSTLYIPASSKITDISTFNTSSNICVLDDGTLDLPNDLSTLYKDQIHYRNESTFATKCGDYSSSATTYKFDSSEMNMDIDY
jgi:type II secretory pathway pseudopilin PulG